MEGKSVKIYEVEKEAAKAPDKPGFISTDGKSNLKVATADGWLHIKTLQLEGKKKMPVADLLRGLKIKENAFFL